MRRTPVCRALGLVTDGLWAGEHTGPGWRPRDHRCGRTGRSHRPLRDADRWSTERDPSPPWQLGRVRFGEAGQLHSFRHADIGHSIIGRSRIPYPTHSPRHHPPSRDAFPSWLGPVHVHLVALRVRSPACPLRPSWSRRLPGAASGRPLSDVPVHPERSSSSATSGGIQEGGRFSMNARMPSRGSGECSSAQNMVW
jgi:hypothetical protein